jgi:hypothetical protein
MQDLERRYARRYVMRIPLAFRPLRSLEMPNQCGQIVDISACGICFSASNALSLGTTVGVFLKLPTNIVGKPAPEFTWTGRVVHVRPSSVSEGATEVGVEFIASDLLEAEEHRPKKKGDS